MTTSEQVPLLSIIIVNYETPDYVVSLLKTLGKDPTIEILLVDNSKKDKLKQQISQDFPHVQYFFSGRNLGFSGGINYGLLEAKGEWVFVLNSDTKASIEDIKKLLMITQKNNCLVSAPKLVGKDGSVQNNVGNLPSFSKGPMNWLLNKPTFLDSKTILQEREVTLLSGAAMLFNKSVVEDIGYFDDENYFIDFVDFDFSQRLAQKKIGILYVPQVSIVHYTDIPFQPPEKIETTLTILGTGTNLSGYHKPFDFRPNAGYLLQYSNKQYLLDCSEGIRERLNHIKIDYFNVDSIFISHFHPDHFNIEPFIQSLFTRALNAKQKKTIILYGPPGIEEYINASISFKRGPSPDEIKMWVNLIFHEFQDQQVYELSNNLRFTPYKVEHDPGLNCFAFKFIFDNHTFVYSGDTSDGDGILNASKNADYFLCESSANIGSKPKGHLNPESVGEIASKSNVKHVIVTHYTGKDTAEEMALAIKKSGFNGEVTIAQDFQEFVL